MTSTAPPEGSQQRGLAMLAGGLGAPLSLGAQDAFKRPH